MVPPARSSSSAGHGARPLSETPQELAAGDPGRRPLVVRAMTTTVSRSYRSTVDLRLFEIPQVSGVGRCSLVLVRDGSGTMRAHDAPRSGRSSGSTHWGSVAVICGSSGCEAAFGRDQRRLSCRGTALVNPVGELVRLATALARIRTAVAFWRIKTGVEMGGTWARGPVGVCRSGAYEMPRLTPPVPAGQRPDRIFERYTVAAGCGQTWPWGQQSAGIGERFAPPVGPVPQIGGAGRVPPGGHRLAGFVDHGEAVGRRVEPCPSASSRRR
jgi:hypothetical protein